MIVDRSKKALQIRNTLVEQAKLRRGGLGFPWC
jgi:hypothetical protein